MTDTNTLDTDLDTDLEAPYQRLTPDLILDALETQGFPCDGRLLPLNSYENRVYQVGLEDRPQVVAKFYRPGRWSDEAISEEHVFSEELAEADLPVVAPASNAEGATLHQHQGFRFSVSPNCGGAGRRWMILIVWPGWGDLLLEFMPPDVPQSFSIGSIFQSRDWASNPVNTS